MKRIKLFIMKLGYWFDYNMGPYLVNERKYTRYLKYLIEQQTKIQELEKEIKNC